MFGLNCLIQELELILIAWKLLFNFQTLKLSYKVQAKLFNFCRLELIWKTEFMALKFSNYQTDHESHIT